MQNIILASNSPRRKYLLEQAGIQFRVVTRGTDESYPADLPIGDVPVYIARNKAKEVNRYLDSAFHQQHSDKTILAADTVVVLDNQIIGKPETEAEAISHLQRLSGREHTVVTGVVILTDEQEVHFSASTQVAFHPLSDKQIRFYVENFKPFDKAGAYGIQEWIGVIGIKHINGDFYNVMGLPVSRVLQELEKLQP